MGRHRNSSYACYAVLFANGQLIAINIDSLRLPSTRLRRFDEALVASRRCCGNPSSDFGVRRLILDQFRPLTTTRRRANLKSARRGPPVMRAKLARRPAVRRETKAFSLRLGAAKAQKQRRRGAIEVQSFKIKTVLWKN